MPATSGWTAALLALLVVLATVYGLIPACVHFAPNVHPPDHVFLGYAMRDCLPEPREQLQFLAAIVLGPTAFLGALWVFSRQSIERYTRPLRSLIAAQLSQIALFGFAAWAFVRNNPHFLFVREAPFIAATASVLLVLVALRRYVLRALELRWFEHVSVVFVVAYCALQLAPTVVNATMLERTPIGVRHHVPFTMGEFAAVLNGKTFLVDAYSQYQNVTPYLLEPLFRITKLSIVSFTASMAVLSCAGLLMMYAALAALMRSRTRAALLFLPVVGLSFIPLERVGAQRTTILNYYAIWPIRYFGVALLLFLTERLLRHGRAESLWHRFALFTIGSAVALNNLDFGVPAFLGCIAAVAVPQRFHRISWRKHAGMTVACAVAASLTTLGAFVTFVWLRSGHMPNLNALTMFQRIFAVHGFYMLPLPTFGAYWAIYLTWMAALFVGLWRWLVHVVTPEVPGPVLRGQQVDLSVGRALPGMLIMCGITGCGISSYYVGRSHINVLPSVYTLWGFTLALLAHAI